MNQEIKVRTLTPVETEWARDHIKRHKNKKAPQGFKFGQPVKFQDKTWLVYDFDAENDAPGGSLAVIVSRDFKQMARYIPVPELKLGRQKEGTSSDVFVSTPKPTIVISTSFGVAVNEAVLKALRLLSPFKMHLIGAIIEDRNNDGLYMTTNASDWDFSRSHKYPGWYRLDFGTVTPQPNLRLLNTLKHLISAEIKHVDELISARFANTIDQSCKQLSRMKKMKPRYAGQISGGMSKELDPSRAMIYFDIHSEDENIEEGANDPDSDNHAFAKKLLANPSMIHDLETKAMQKAKSLLKRTRISNEGHDRFGNLISKFGVDSWEDVDRIYRIVKRNFGGGDDEIYLNVPYFAIRGFTLYPQGVNGPRIEFKDWDDWLDDHKPDRRTTGSVDASLLRLSKFDKGKSVDVPAYLREHGNDEAADSWEEMHDKYKDQFKS